MAIRVKETKVHWNYFLALEIDVIRVARFIEFREDNFQTYSIELVRLLMAASSEVDVVAKLVCRQLQPGCNPRNIMHYASIILPAEPKLASLTVLLPRFGLTLKPWISWTVAAPPLWWNAYNGVKHQRNTRFQDANLGNTLNSIAALYALTLYHYSLSDQTSLTFADGTSTKTQRTLASASGRRSLTARLQPEPELFRLRTLLGDLSDNEDEGPNLGSQSSRNLV